MLQNLFNQQIQWMMLLDLKYKFTLQYKNTGIESPRFSIVLFPECD